MRPVNGKQSLYVLLIHGGIALAVVCAATLLAYHGALDAEAATAIFGAALGLAGGSASALAALGSAVNGKMTVTPEAVQAREVTLRQALASPAIGGVVEPLPDHADVQPGQASP